MKPCRGPTEMQLLGNRYECLELPHLHRTAPHFPPGRLNVEANTGFLLPW